MRAFVKGFVVWTLGLAVLLGSLGVSLARQRVKGSLGCSCACQWGGGVGGCTGDLYWDKVGECSGAEGKNCSYTQNGKTYKGKLADCMECVND